MELLDVVNEADEVIGTMTREEAYKTNAIVRVVDVLVFKPSVNKLVLQQRLPNKSYPLCFDCSAAGHVLSGEDYLFAAKRELDEELGITSDVLNFVGTIRTYNLSSGNLKKIHHVFFIEHEGPYSIFEEEMAGIIEVGQDELKRTVLKTPEKFTRNFLKIYDELIVSKELFNRCSGETIAGRS